VDAPGRLEGRQGSRSRRGRTPRARFRSPATRLASQARRRAEWCAGGAAPRASELRLPWAYEASLDQSTQPDNPVSFWSPATAAVPHPEHLSRFAVCPAWANATEHARALEAGETCYPATITLWEFGWGSRSMWASPLVSQSGSAP
jgi:hypothetical protein